MNITAQVNMALKAGMISHVIKASLEMQCQLRDQDASALRRLNEAIESGKVKVVVGKIFS